MTTPLPDQSAVTLARLLRDGEISAEELMAACLDRITVLEPNIKAWAFLERDQALRAARDTDSRRANSSALGVLHGLPVGVKDIYDTLEMPTEFGTPVHKGRRPAIDAAIVQRLRRAGAVLVGRPSPPNMPSIPRARRAIHWIRPGRPADPPAARPRLSPQP